MSLAPIPRRERPDLRDTLACNFQQSSAMWDALALSDAVRRSRYASTSICALPTSSRTPTPTTIELAAHLYPAVVLRTKSFRGGYVRNRARHLAVDHPVPASHQLELRMECRVGQHEFGVLLDNPNLTEQSCIVERVAGIALGRQAATLVAQLTRLVEARRSTLARSLQIRLPAALNELSGVKLNGGWPPR